MSDLNKWVKSAIEQDFLPTPDLQDVTKAVKIAVLDTGAKFTKAILQNHYDNRVREIRKWHLASASAQIPDSGIHIPDGDDEDGHGTHSTSLVLNATQNTDCLVYVAKVFGSKQDKQYGEVESVTEGIGKVR